ncbi:MAG: glycosyltransferase [Brevundimonas sp.]|uniref:glycosyltransferase n=1 Tax=Brevundimonas sp. TaxID=1871086 RepID=UPI003002C8CA
MPDTLILVGGFGLPDRTASATRAIGLAKLFRSIGMKVVIMGKITPEVPPIDGPTEMEVDGIRCVDLRRPFPGRDYARYDLSGESVMALVDSLPAGSVRAVSAYNHAGQATWSILRGCKARGIPAILDCTEWYGWEGKKILRNIQRMAWTEFRLRILTRKAGNVIAASRWFSDTLPGLNRVLLPFVIDASDPKWSPEPPRLAMPDGRRRFLYSGSPGLGMIKDRLPVAIEGFGALEAEGIPFEFRIVGMTRGQYLADRPDHADLVARLGDSLKFLGRIPHADSLLELRATDYALFFRRDDRIANTGFATKYVEAASLGIPVVTNPTSDIDRYLTDGHNGFLAPDLSTPAIAEVLRCAATLGDADLLAMKSVCAAANPFDIPPWQAPARAFLDALRPVR